MPKTTHKLIQNGRTIYGPAEANPDGLTALTGKRGRHSDGANLYYVVGFKGEHRWAFYYKHRSRKLASGLPAPVEMGVGSAPDGSERDCVSLASARRRAAEHRATLQKGLDPLEEKRKAKGDLAPVVPAAAPVIVAADPAENNIDFGTYADQYFDQVKGSWKGKIHARQWLRSLTVEAAALRAMRIRDIETAHVLNVLRPIFEKTPETGKRLQSRIHAVLSSATVDKYRSDTPNPARWKGHLDRTTLPKRKTRDVRNHPALPYTEMPVFMGELRQRNSLSALALQFTIGTLGRTSEIIKAEWREIDFDAKLWIVPPIRMKGSKEHRVPLTDSMLALLADVRKISHGDYIFAVGQGRPLSNQAMSELLKGMHPPSVATVHGFRSSFRDWAGDESADIDPTIAEFCLAHVIGDKAEKAYRRGTALTKRRKALDEWDKFIFG